MQSLTATTFWITNNSPLWKRIEPPYCIGDVEIKICSLVLSKVTEEVR